MTPKCAYCGKPLKPYTKNHYVIDVPLTEPQKKAGYVQGPLRSKDEAQALTNERVLAVRYNRDPKTVWWYSTWDGQSYRDATFCSRDCGYLMGKAAVKAGYIMKRRAA